MGGTSYNMKPMPFILIFSAAPDSLSNMWNFYWYPCLVIKLDNAVKSDIIYISPPVIH